MVAKETVALLKACALQKDLHKGTAVHANILRSGLFEKDPYIGSALVSMYAKCGALAKAQLVLDELPERDVVSWTSLIVGYVQEDERDEAWNCFYRMKCEGICPNEFTYSCILRACGSIQTAADRKQIHCEIATQGLLGKSIVLGTALVDMYAKCSELVEALEVLDELPLRSVASYNALISGYVQEGYEEEALNCFLRMESEGLSPDGVTYTCILNACGSFGAASLSGRIHDEIIKRDLLSKDTVLGNALLDMYVKCGALDKAQEVLDELPASDIISWNTLLAGYVLQNQAMEAFSCYKRMQCEGHSPDAVTLACILKICGPEGSKEGIKIHNEIISRGLFGNNAILDNSLLDMYATCGMLDKAQELLEELPVCNTVSWNTLIAGYTRQGLYQEALNCFERMQHESLSPSIVTFLCILKAYGSLGAVEKGKQVHGEIVSQGLLGKDVALDSSLVEMYSKCGLLAKAQSLHDELGVRNAVSWNSLISGYVQQGQSEDALTYLEQMQVEGLSPDPTTFCSILKACGFLGAADKGKQIHDEIATEGLLGKSIVLGNALLDMYAKCGVPKRAQQILDMLPNYNVYSYNILIAGYAQMGQGLESLTCYEYMQCKKLIPTVVTFASVLKACGSIGAADKGKQIHDNIVSQDLVGKDLVLDNVLVDMYVKCGALSKAQQVLCELPVRDTVSWSSLILGFTQKDQCWEALHCFEQMHLEGCSPNGVTFIGVLKACGNMGAVVRGIKVHDEIIRRGLLENDVTLGNALSFMYARCGALARSQQVLDDLPSRNLVSWNALISGYAQHGQGKEALFCFGHMQIEGLLPDAISFTCVLNACGRSGLLDEGQAYLADMSRNYHITPDIKHNCCMVDILGHAGHLEKAMVLIKKNMDPPRWSAFLIACMKWGNVKLGRWAFDQAVHIQ